MEARSWIETDESAKEMLARTLAQQPLLLLPPLHRVPLRIGNVVEIVGPSASAKSEILLQAAVNCILPKEWNGVHFGGLERLVMYFDLDCRFDVLRLSEVLRCRLTEARGFSQGGMQIGSQKRDGAMMLAAQGDDELFQVCMRRFMYIRCYSSYEFLAALKTVQCQIQKEHEAQGVGVHFLMIDSINAFYWMDRESQPLPRMGCNRRNLSLQCITESIVLEINKLLKIEPVLVLATKATILGIEPTRNEAQRWLSHHFVGYICQLDMDVWDVVVRGYIRFENFKQRKGGVPGVYAFCLAVICHTGYFYGFQMKILMICRTVFSQSIPVSGWYHH